MSNLRHQMATVQQVADHADPGTRRSCLTGLYLLTADAELARFGIQGEILMEPELSAALSLRLQAALSQYRSGALEELNLGLVANTEFEQSWDTGTLIFSDHLVNALLQAGHSPDTPSSLYAQRNRTQTVFQGMDLLLNTKSPTQPLFPCFCPVLFVPEVGHDALCERYGVDFIAEEGLFEVLDLAAPFASNVRPPNELVAMVERMRDAQTEAVCTSLDSVPVHGRYADPDQPVETVTSLGTGLRGFGPFPDAGDTCFEEGDPVSDWLLEWFSPFNELTNTQREIIAGYEVIRKESAGTRLIDRGDHDDQCIYLVEGTLALSAPDGETIRVTGGTRRARLPICVLNPHAYLVIAVTDASVVVFSQKLIRRINEITRTYTGVAQAGALDATTTAISNGLQAAYLNRTLLPYEPESDSD